MNSEPLWLTARAFADTAGISPRAAQKALARALEGRSWRGSMLIVRRTPSRGGKAGLSFQVRADSLPSAAGLTRPAAAPAAPTPTPTGRRCAAAVAKRHEIIQPALQHPPGSPERKQAVREAARRAGKSERRIYELIAAYDKSGLAGVARRRRADLGGRRCRITRTYDQAVPFDEATKAEIAEKTELRVRSLWARTTEHGWRWIARLAGDYLMELTREAGFQGDERELKAICKLPHNFVMRWGDWRAVAIHDQDAKQWHDRHRPRIARTRFTRGPMEIVVCDVHPMDVLLPRPDGTTFTAKLVAFEDWATARVFLHPVFLPKGQGVRQEHVAEAIVAMTQDPQWGLPQLLYIDNGGEYGCAELAADAMQLNTEARSWQVRALEDDPELSKALRHRRATVKAKPYNASAKSVEGTFNVLEKGVFSMLPGWIGGNRMAKKTANVGRAPGPYPHGEEAFREDLRNCVIAYETHPQTGQLDGRSPRQVFEEALAAGWERMDVSRGALLAAFARDDSRMVRQGKFTLAAGGQKSRTYTARELQALPAGTHLHLRVPIWGDCNEIPVLTPKGGLLCMAQAERLYDALDREGAREAGRRLKVAEAGVEALRADTEPLDMRKELAALAARQAPATVPESAGVVRLGEGMEAVGRALERAPVARRADEIEHEEISEERRLKLAAQYLERTGTDG